MTLISSIAAREILDSRGNPTVETTVRLESGASGTAAVPSGASVGSHEAVELRDHDKDRYDGMGVLTAVSNVNTILAGNLIGKNISSQNEIDQAMIDLDGTENKSKLGANSILSISLAFTLAMAADKKIPLYQHIAELATTVGLAPQSLRIPTPTFNIINGGKHGSGNLDIQEFHVAPATNIPYNQALRMGVEIYQHLKGILAKHQASFAVGDEGGFSPTLYSNLDACAAIIEAIRLSRYKIGREVFFGLDIAANHFFANGKYQIKDKETPLSREEFSDYLLALNKDYPLIYLEDPLVEDDWDGWIALTAKAGSGITIVGDDLLVTDSKRLERAITTKACTGILVKPNQVGTLSEMLWVVKQAKEANFKTILSHRSGETNDSYLADIAVGIAADYVKFGAPARGERVAKYNRLLAIEAELQKQSSI